MPEEMSVAMATAGMDETFMAFCLLFIGTVEMAGMHY
jgi:hypothetical protein